VRWCLGMCAHAVGGTAAAAARLAVLTTAGCYSTVAGRAVIGQPLIVCCDRQPYRIRRVLKDCTMFG
jgi:hypothetical protein